MSTLQIRNVPDELSRELKARAAREGRSLSDYLLSELERVAARPSRAELYERIQGRSPNGELPPASEVLERERARRP